MREGIVVLENVVVGGGALEHVDGAGTVGPGDHLEQVLVLHAHVREELAVGGPVFKHVTV